VAFNIERIDPLDRQPRKAIGVSIPFSGDAVFNSTYQTKDAIKANLINYFLTNKRERFFNLDFGSNITSLLFDNITPEKIEQIKATVEEEISLYFPRVLISDFNIYSNIDSQTISVYMQYSVVSSNIQDEILINIEQ
jgi:phage baseplate assembly protein W